MAPRYENEVVPPEPVSDTTRPARSPIAYAFTPRDVMQCIRLTFTYRLTMRKPIIKIFTR